MQHRDYKHDWQASCCSHLLWLVPGQDGSVVLLGDSVVNNPCVEYNLLGKMHNMSHFSFGYTNCGIPSNTISRIKWRLPTLLQNISFVAKENKYVSSVSEKKLSRVMVILFWNSDASDIDETDMSMEEVRVLRYKYKEDLREVIQQILNSGAYMAIAGPEVFDDPSKTSVFDAYKDINIAIANSFDMEYIDMRTAFLNEINADRNPIVDLEHPNEHGTDIIAKLFVEALWAWKTTE
eukprot:gene1120-2179_t